MRAERLNGIHIHHETGGPATAPVLVFVNSLGTDFRVWDRVVARLEGRVRWVRYDKRGHGLSDAPPAPYAMADHVGDLAALLDHLAIRGATVCGLSVGGMIAQGLAVARPELVGRLILSDTAHRIGTDAIWNERIAALRDGGIEALADNVMIRWFSDAFRRDRADEVVLWRAMVTRTPIDGYLGTCVALRDADLTEATRTIAKPTLCIGGTEDGSTPPDLVRELAALIPGATFHEIPAVGHLPCVEAPDTVATLISDFMGL